MKDLLEKCCGLNAQWIATLLRARLLNASFIPEKSIREPRHLTRYRKSIVHDITSVTKGNPYIKSILCEVAWVIAGKRNSYLSTQYWKLKQKKGAKKAIIALARKLLVIIYTMLKYGICFDESCLETRRKMYEQSRTSHYIRELEKRGFHVEFPA